MGKRQPDRADLLPARRDAVRDPSRYDELTGLIDFYVYIALGLELDSYGYLGGDAMYSRAWQIAQRYVDGTASEINVQDWVDDGKGERGLRGLFVRDDRPL